MCGVGKEREVVGEGGRRETLVIYAYCFIHSPSVPAVKKVMSL